MQRIRDFIRQELLLVVLALASVLLALAQPRPMAQLVAMVEWPTIAALGGLLLVTKGVENSGFLAPLARRLVARVTGTRTLAIALVLAAAVLAAVLTNDVSLFLLVPLTKVIAKQARLPFLRLVVLEALAVNAGSSLTPVGNPQNLHLWHRSGESLLGYTAMMLPAAAVMLVLTVATAWLLVPAGRIAPAPPLDAPPVDRRLLALSGVLFVLFLIALDRQQAALGLLVVAAAFLLGGRSVLAQADWKLLLVFVLMFVCMGQLATLDAIAPLVRAVPPEGAGLYAAAIGLSQVVSNVPASIALAPLAHDLPRVAEGVNVGGYGFIFGSLANVIAMRLAAAPGFWGQYHRVGVPFLLVCAPAVYLAGAWLR